MVPPGHPMYMRAQLPGLPGRSAPRSDAGGKTESGPGTKCGHSLVSAKAR